MQFFRGRSTEFKGFRKAINNFKLANGKKEIA